MSNQLAQPPPTSKTCRRCSAPFVVAGEEIAFLEKISPKIGGKLLDIPLPTLCVNCRMQRRMAHRNQIYVSLRTAPESNQKFFSMYLGETEFPVVQNDVWWDEKDWDPLRFGRPFDFSRPFFAQWQELRNLVPRPALNTISGTIENSEYCNNAGWVKDCYFCFDVDRSRECLYMENLADCTDCVDCSAVVNCELCYDCTACTNCYNLQSSGDCIDCSDSWFLRNCKSCTDCFCCVNLRQKKYCVFNKQLTKEAFHEFMASKDLSSWKIRTVIETEFAAFCREHPRPHLVGLRADNCTGNHIFNSQDVVNGYFIHGAEDIRNSDIMKTGGKSCYDCTISFVNPELMYECAICGLSVFNLLFCYNCWDGAADLLYCDTSHGSKHCFGCVCLRKRSFCILNTQYSEAEYHSLVPKIVEHMRETGEWGEYFPMNRSAWPYNVSYANRYFPLTEEQAREEGLQWHSNEPIEGSKGLQQKLPDRLPETDDPILTRCASSGKLFRITTPEIKRLRRFSAPLPRKAYDERMNDRSARCGGLTLTSRMCDRSGEPVQTVYTKNEAPILWSKNEFDREFA